MSKAKLANYRVLCQDQWVEVKAEGFGTNLAGELVFQIEGHDVALFAAQGWACVLQNLPERYAD